MIRSWLVTALAMMVTAPLMISEVQAQSPVKLAVLGNSDSHSYHDSLWFEPGSGDRGGPYRATTLQWTEIVHRLRGSHVDPGPWGQWGTRTRIARVLRGLGFAARSPRKEDFKYNFAFSGAGCEDLVEGSNPQAVQLTDLIAEQPAAWREAIVVVRIGINSIGRSRELTRFAAAGLTQPARELIQRCVGAIQNSIALVRRQQPDVRFVLVGIFDNSNWTTYFGRWPATTELENIRTALDFFDDQLRRIEAGDSRVAFFDDRAWFARHWGDPPIKEAARYRSVTFGGPTGVTNTQGDHPSNAVLADGHAGTAWNALWADALLQLTAQKFGIPVKPIAIDEMACIIDPDGSFGINTRGGTSREARAADKR